MWRRFFNALTFLALTTSAYAAPVDPSAQIRAVLDAQVRAWNRGDIDAYMNGYARSDKLEFVSRGKITRGWRTVRDRYRKKYNSREAMGTLGFSDLKVRMLGQWTALVTGRWELKRKKDRPHGTFTLTFRHLPEGWRIVHDQTS